MSEPFPASSRPAPRAWLARFFGAPIGAKEAGRLSAIEQRLANVDRQLAALQVSEAPGPASAELGSIQEALSGLEKQLARLGREQLKANLAAEAQASQLAEAFEQLRAAEARRDAELLALREQQRQAQTSARLDVVRALLPALDGLDEALRAGQHLLAATPAEPPAPTEGGWLQRLLGPPPAAHSAGETSREALEAWLTGLGFVRQRLLDVLAAEDVRPIATQGEGFDPLQHVAVEAVLATAEHEAGRIVEERRRGYLAGERVLRYAEVVVAAEHLRSSTSLGATEGAEA